jgi:glycosyltransferase involved in cell wall biosynthesis
MYANIGAPVWKVLGKRVGLWYAHGHVSLSLKVAEKLVGDVFTSTKEGCRMNSKKIQIVGQGINTDKFKKEKLEIRNSEFSIITIGRIAPIKNYETLILALDILVNEKKQKNIRVKVIGETLLAEHKSYSAKLRELVTKKNLENYIEFTGSVPYSEILPYIQSADLFVSTSRTGSLDKVMLEAMSCGVSVVACNEAVGGVLGDYSDDLMYVEGDCKELAKRIEFIYNLNDNEMFKIGNNLRAVVVKNHGISSLIKKIIS